MAVGSKQEGDMTEEKEIQTVEVETPKRKTFTDVLREAAENVDREMEKKPGKEVQNVGKIITLLKGDRVFSEKKTIAPGITIKLGNLTARHKNFISSVCLDDNNLDEDGNPKYNEQLSLDITLAFMWSELNGVSITDPMDPESGIDKISDLWDEISDRSKVFNNWPASWLKNFINTAKEFTEELIATCSEENVKAF